MRPKLAAVSAVLCVVVLVALAIARGVGAQVLPSGKGRVIDAAPASLAYEIVKAPPVQNPPKKVFSAMISCPSGKKVVGGGLQQGSDFFHMTQSYPVDGSNWFASGYNDGPAGGVVTSVTLYAICIVAN